MSIRTLIAFLSFSLILAADDNPGRSAPTGTVELAAFAKALQGCWQNEDAEDHCIWFLPSKCIQIQSGSSWPRGDLARYQDGHVILGHAETERQWKCEVQGGKLLLSGPEKAIRFRKLARVPASLQELLTPLPLGQPGELSAERLAAIQKEIAERYGRDQKVRELCKDEKAQERRRQLMQEVDTENRAYFVKLVQEVGWLDVSRFGRDTANQAFIMMLHYPEDWRLMQAVVPAIERDVRAGQLDARRYIELHRRARFCMGEKDRFGAVLWNINKRMPEVGPLEEPAKVNEYRRELGLPPLEQEIEQMKQTYEKLLPPMAKS